ncbi:FIGNL1-interacting regulator of recombination and mitosis isoform X1 [Phyllopteryx taeniolatus]|uniref:FIGNL1-interacting regulator of recombination and mitosis isoform X1 n=1 Tax=Phyllopteryx taeniolatus TaxID=161469 RepID=UPI002AD2B463|nr:FIGNL1-interacting regulator of recombination and mitosis isoform X1 [Phyllopteryx taeniolatus]XP_061635972.1 FIGNL1-interacting regulator of recombination and mitosis isoform X1 [Phyllopteryx taeniolatus]
MSQTNTSLLDEVVQWSQETCREELKAVLPKLTSLHHKSEGWDDHIRVLKIITDMFLPHVALSDLENECFSKILPKAVTMFDSMMKELSIQVGGLSSQNTELCSLLRNILKSLMQIIDAMSACVRHVGTYDEVPDLVSIRTLPTCILKVLRDTFQHCKESEVFYCGRLSLVADLLQSLFKEAYALHKALLELLDRLSLDGSSSEEDVSDVVIVIHSLLDICSVISNLDMALHANTWKFLIKQSLKYQSLVEEDLRHGDISSSLCGNLLASFHNAVDLAEQINLAGLQEATQSPEHKLFQKTAKMCRFFANTLVHYVKEFKAFLTRSCRSFHQMYLQILSKFPPSLFAPALPPSLSEDLNAAAVVPMDALLFQLLPLRPFAEVVLQEDLRLSPQHELPQCLLLANVLEQLASQPEEVLQLWQSGSQFSEETPRLPLYRAVLRSFRHCYAERKLPVLLPGVMIKGQAQGQVSLHHHVCVHLCASVAVLPPQYFPVLELCLVEATLQADTQTALLAADVWCFTARYGTAELCLHHVLLIAHLVKTCSAECYQTYHLGLLLRRMLFLMTPSHQMDLLARFPPSEAENLPIWRHVLLRALSNDASQRVVSDVITLGQTVLTDWQSGGYKLGQVCKVNAVLQCLLVVVQGKSPLETQCASSASRIVTELWQRMAPHQVQIHHVLHSTLQLLLSLTAVLVKNMEMQVIIQALVCVDAVMSQKCADELLLAALEFLSSLGKVFIPPDSRSDIVPRLGSLFGTLLAESSSWLLHQHALEAFAHFAEVTNHEEVISYSLCVEETKSKVVNFLSKTVNTPEGVEESRLERIEAEKTVLEQHYHKLETSNQVSTELSAQSVTHSEPQAKRARQESGADEEYSCYMQAAERALRALHALVTAKTDTQEPPPAPRPPSWLASRLQELQVLLSDLSSATSINKPM